MAQFGGGQMQMPGPQTGWCDYCHQKPKFPPYNYCGKVCGSKAKAAGGPPSNGPVMCKQCGQRPVYKGHQFCGKNCANTWQSMYGQINTGGHGQQQHYGHQSWNPMPPPQMQNNPSQPLQGYNQGGGIKGLVQGLKGLVLPNQQPQQYQPIQQQPGPPPYMHQAPGRTSPNFPIISPPITPVSSGMGSPMSPGMGGPMTPGTFDPMTPGTPTTSGLNQHYYTPSSPASPGIQDPDTNDQTNRQNFSLPPLPAPHSSKQNSTPIQKSKTANMTVNTRATSTGGGTQPNDSPDFDPHADPDQDPMGTPNSYQPFGQNQNTGGSIPIQAQAQFSIQVTSTPTGAGGHGNGNWDQNDANYFPSQPLTSTSSGSSTTCRLKGCNKPVFVDPETHYPSEYCSQRHREDAKIFGQVNPCIMCLEMPRGSNDHFCSTACREKALSP